jgi:hypothetical protein
MSDTHLTSSGLSLACYGKHESLTIVVPGMYAKNMPYPDWPDTALIF